MKCIVGSTRIMLVLLLLTYFQLRCIAQDRAIDSLKALLQSEPGVDFSEVQLQLARAYLDIDNELALNYATSAFENAKEGSDSLLLVKSGRITGQALRRLGKMDSAITLFDEILPVAKRNNFSYEFNTILNSLAVTYIMTAQYDTALKYLFASLQASEIESDKFWKSVALGNIGLVYQSLKDYDKANSYFVQSLPLQKELGDQRGIYILLINISQCAAYTGDFVRARELVNEVFSSCYENCADDILESLYNNLGLISFLEHKYSDAEKQFLKSYTLSKKLKSSRLALENLGYLVKLSIENNNRDAAEKYLKEFDFLIGQGVPYNHEIVEAYPRLISLYEKSKNHEKVAFYQKKYITLKDSIFDETLTTNLMKIEAEHIERENKAKIESQTRILALNGEIIDRQRYLNIFIGLVALLLVIVTVLLIKSNRQKQKINVLLDKRVSERTKELQLNRDALLRACEERDQIIHKTSSDIKTSLVTLKGLCTVGLKDINDPVALDYLTKMEATSDNFFTILNQLHVNRDGMSLS